MKKKQAHIIAFLLLFCLVVKIGFGQELKDDLLIYKSPSEDFKDIVLQAHKGLTRLGQINNYAPSNAGKGVARLLDEATKEKNRKIQSGYSIYTMMAQLKFNMDLVGKMSKERPVTITYESTKEDESISRLQNSLHNLNNNICNTDKCKNGFLGKNEFEKSRYYKSYMINVLPNLTSWNDALLKENNLKAYFVHRINLGSYDFDKNGFWIFCKLKIQVIGSGRGQSSINSIYTPKYSYENELLNKFNSRGQQVFLPMAPEKAEELQKNRQTYLFAVQKINISFGKEETSNKMVTASYNFEKPDMEFYKDMGLQEKVATISLDKATIKTQ